MVSLKKRLIGALLVGVLSSISVGAYAAPKDDVGVLACRNTSAGIPWDGFTAYTGVYSYQGTVDVASSSQNLVQISIQFTQGSPGVYVHLVNQDTNYTTGDLLFTSSNSTRTFSVGCGYWKVEMKSGSSVGNPANGQFKADIF